MLTQEPTFKYTLCRQKFLPRLLFMAIVLLFAFNARANMFTDKELDTLVSTIALYPDPLLVQVLAASVHGDEIPGAYDWAMSHKDLQGEALADAMEEENLPYDQSVQAIIPFPTVLATMAKYQVWTDQLGDAVATQKEAVMDAVQRMRNSAYEHGHLKSNEQTKVIKEKTIIIEPVQKEYVYVPVYNPYVVYYSYANGYPSLRYHTGVWVGGTYGAWGWGYSWFEWDTHLIYVRDYRWHHNRPIPRHSPRYNPPPRHEKVPMNHRYSNNPNKQIYHNNQQYSNQNSSATMRQRAAQAKPVTIIKSQPNVQNQQIYKVENNRENHSSVGSVQSYGRNANQNDEYQWTTQNNVRQSTTTNKGFGKSTATYSSGNSNRGGYNSSRSQSGSSGRSHGGFGKSVRK